MEFLSSFLRKKLVPEEEKEVVVNRPSSPNLNNNNNNNNNSSLSSSIVDVDVDSVEKQDHHLKVIVNNEDDTKNDSVYQSAAVEEVGSEKPVSRRIYEERSNNSDVSLSNNKVCKDSRAGLLLYDAQAGKMMEPQELHCQNTPATEVDEFSEVPARHSISVQKSKSEALNERCSVLANTSKGKCLWSKGEDDKLAACVKNEYPQVDWHDVAAKIPGRSAGACRERWNRCIKSRTVQASKNKRQYRVKDRPEAFESDQSLDQNSLHEMEGKSPWSRYEDNKLKSMIDKETGIDWDCISKILLGRTVDACIARWLRVIAENKGELIYLKSKASEQWSDDEIERLLFMKEHDLEWKECEFLIPDKTSPICQYRWKKYSEVARRRKFATQESDFFRLTYQDLGRTRMNKYDGTTRWKEKDDLKLMAIKERNQYIEWCDVARDIPGKTAGACRERWESLIRGSSKLVSNKRSRNVSAAVTSRIWVEADIEKHLFTRERKRKRATAPRSGSDYTETRSSDELVRETRTRARKRKRVTAPHSKNKPTETVQQVQTESTEKDRESETKSSDKLLQKPRTCSQNKLPQKRKTENQNGMLWTEEDFSELVEMRKKEVNWDDVAKKFSGRSAESCKGVYERRGFADVVWSKEEDENLCFIKENNPDALFKEISKAFPGRSEKSVRNRWIYLLDCKDNSSNTNNMDEKSMDKSSSEHSSGSKTVTNDHGIFEEDTVYSRHDDDYDHKPEVEAIQKQYDTLKKSNEDLTSSLEESQRSNAELRSELEHMKQLYFDLSRRLK